MKDKEPAVKTRSGIRCPACGAEFEVKERIDEHVEHEHKKK